MEDVFDHADLAKSLLRTLSKVTDSNAKRHLYFGLIRRHWMIVEGFRTIAKIAYPGRCEPLGLSEAERLNINLNAFYLNVAGALDNLAWVLQYQFGIVPDCDEENRKTRMKCALFTPEFSKGLSKELSSIAVGMKQHEAWWKDLKELRDPAAHRVPVHVARGFLHERDLEAYHEIERVAIEQYDRGERDSLLGYKYEQQQLTQFQPIMILSGSKGFEQRPLESQMVTDRDRYIDVISLGLTAF